MVKPEDNIYQYVINTLKAKPEDIYFFDDIEKNVQAAKECGIQAFCVTGNTIKDIFYLTAGGIATLYNEFNRPLDQFPKLQKKFYTIHHKWCRRYTSGLRRDYISSISESLNGAIKRETARKTQINLVKSLPKHSARAYHQCHIEALSWLHQHVSG